MKIVRMLLRVSSNQQLEADGDLGVQRQIVLDYVKSQQYWILDDKEYFEGSKSGYRNSVKDRDVLQEALKDAKNGEYDILVAYKDDRIGRRMWEIGDYVMQLKQNNVDIYTVKDGCISPESNDIMGQIVLALRYGNAQKSSADTGMRVKDTAQKLVSQGKFMGGKAPYGYELVLSGEISKHGRALHKLQIIPEKAEVVKRIFELSALEEYGSSKIAKILNCDDYYKNLAPIDTWKGGTINSILTNPIYTGRTAYKRREKINNLYKKLDSKDWIIAEEPNQDIRIIDESLWDKAQASRLLRSNKYAKELDTENVTVIRNGNGMLPLIDVIHCAYCGSKLTNGSRYNYWTIKDTGEKKASIYPIYKCQKKVAGIPHDEPCAYLAKDVDPIVFDEISKYLDVLMDGENVLDDVININSKQKKVIKEKLEAQEKLIEKTKDDIKTLEDHIPDTLKENYPLSLQDITRLINDNKSKLNEQQEEEVLLYHELKNLEVSSNEANDFIKSIPTWKEVLLSADAHTKRVLVNKLIERIDISKDQINIKFKINLNHFIRK